MPDQPAKQDDTATQPLHGGPWPRSLLSRIEDAGINASAPPQQRWIDGWLVRYSPGKAKRARCIQAVANGLLPLDERLNHCAALFKAQGLPLMVRVTPFSQPAGLDQALAERGYRVLDDTRVMVLALPSLPTTHQAAPAPGHVLNDPTDIWPASLTLTPAGPDDYAQAVGQLRESPPSQRQAHAERLKQSPAPYQGWLLRQAASGQVLCCAQTAQEDRLVGLYDVFTAAPARGRGLARQLCRHLLLQAMAQGASTAYLQVDANNHPARQAYQRLGFTDAYAYHYRTSDANAD